MADEKICPHCNGPNPKDAKVCEWCKSEFGASAQTTVTSQPKNSLNVEFSQIFPVMGIALVLMVVWWLVSWFILRAVFIEDWITISYIGFGMIATFFVVLPFLKLFLPVEYESAITWIAVIIWLLVIIFLLWRIETIRKTFLSTVQPITSVIIMGWKNSLCVARVAVGQGDITECEQKETKTLRIIYYPLEIKEGVKVTDASGGGVNYLSNSKPDDSKPYRFTFTLENNNAKNSNFIINVTKAEIQSSKSRDFLTDTENAIIPALVDFQPHTIYPQDYWVVRSDFDKLPVCDYYLYFKVKATSFQEAGSTTEFTIYPKEEGNENKIRQVDPVTRIIDGPVDVVAFIDTRQNYRALVLNKGEDFDIFLRFENDADDSSAVINSTNLSSTLPGISLDCPTDSFPIILYEKYSEKGSSIAEIKCNGRVDASQLQFADNSDKKTSLISVSAVYEYTQEVTFTKSAVCSRADSSSSSYTNLTDIQNKIVAAAKKEGVPADIALAICEKESGCQHYDSPSSVKRGSSGEVGLMQVMPGGGGCSESELMNLDKNIECGVKVIKEKHDGYLPTVKTCDKYNTRSICYDYYDCGYSRYKDEWDRAIRGYNGWGCPTEANKQYVETVNALRPKYSQYA